MIELLIDGLATYRLSRLISEDSILDRQRAMIQARGGKPAELVGCPWCLSVWFAAAMPAIPGPVRRLLALSTIAGLIAHEVQG